MARFDKLSVPIAKHPEPIAKHPEPVEGCFYPKLLRRYVFSRLRRRSFRSPRASGDKASVGVKAGDGGAMSTISALPLG